MWYCWRCTERYGTFFLFNDDRRQRRHLHPCMTAGHDGLWSGQHRHVLGTATNCRCHQHRRLTNCGESRRRRRSKRDLKELRVSTGCVSGHYTATDGTHARIVHIKSIQKTTEKTYSKPTFKVRMTTLAQGNQQTAKNISHCSMLLRNMSPHTQNKMRTLNLSSKQF